MYDIEWSKDIERSPQWFWKCGNMIASFHPLGGAWVLWVRVYYPEEIDLLKESQDYNSDVAGLVFEARDHVEAKRRASMLLVESLVKIASRYNRLKNFVKDQWGYW